MNFAGIDNATVKARRAAIIGAASSLACLGILNIVYGDVLLQWQPAPAAATWRGLLGYVSGVILIASGLGIIVPMTQRMAASIGAGWLGLWLILLHLPVVAAAHGSVASLNGMAENGAMMLGIMTLCISSDNDRSARAIQIGFGVCCLTFGLAHFIYANFTAEMVPAWLPARLAIAYLTGAVHAAVGLFLVLGVAPRLIAAIEGTMMASFVGLLHIPSVIANPASRLDLTMLAVASLLTSAAWLVTTMRVNTPMH